MFLGMSSKVLDPTAVDCVKLQAWDKKDTGSDDDELFVMVVNSGKHELIFNNSMVSITRSGGDAGVKFRTPAGVALDTLGNVYVTDTEAGCVIKLKLDDKNRLKYVANFNGGGGSDEKLQEPMGVCTSHDGRVFVTDRLKNAVFVFDSQGSLLEFFEGGLAGQKGIFQPIDIDVLQENDKWNYFGQNSIYLLDMDGKRIQRLSMEGERELVVYVQDLGMSGVDLTSIATDYYSNVYVTDVNNHCVHKLNRKLEYLAAYGERGTGDGQFMSPSCISIWRRFGQVFITDSTGIQYMWIGTDLLLPADGDEQRVVVRSDEKGRRSVNVAFELVEPSEILMYIKASNGEEIPLFEWRKYFARKVNLTLPLGETDAVPLEGSKLVIKVRATYSSKQSFEKKLTLPVTVIN